MNPCFLDVDDWTWVLNYEREHMIMCMFLWNWWKVLRILWEWSINMIYCCVVKGFLIYTWKHKCERFSHIKDSKVERSLTQNESKKRSYSNIELIGGSPWPPMLKKSGDYKCLMNVKKVKNNEYSMWVTLSTKWTSGDYPYPIKFVPT